MSRHEIAAYDPAHKVIVGWDRPMLNYFVQVIDRKRKTRGETLTDSSKAAPTLMEKERAY